MEKRVFLEAASIIGASLALLVVTTGGCSQQDGGGAPPTAPGEQPLAPPEKEKTNTANAQPLQANPCEDFGSLTGNALTAKLTDMSESFLLPLVSRPVTSRLGVIAT